MYILVSILQFNSLFFKCLYFIFVFYFLYISRECRSSWNVYPRFFIDFSVTGPLNTNLISINFSSNFSVIASTHQIYNVESSFLLVLQENHCHQITPISFGLLLVFDVVGTQCNFSNHHYRSGTTFKKERKLFYLSESSPVLTFINVNTKKFSYHIFILYFLALGNF